MITPEQLKAATPERFWRRVKFGELNDCWEWTGAHTKAKYGRYQKNKILFYAHRVAFISIHGDTSLFVLHSCHNPRCCNVNHLRAGTHKDNMQDKVKSGRAYVGNHCGSKQWSAKLKEANIPIIRKRLKSGESQTSIAKNFGVSPTTIWMIENGARWSKAVPIMPPIYITTESGEIVNLAEKFIDIEQRLKNIERSLKVFDIPKTRKKMKSERIKFIERQLLNSYK